MTLLFVLFTTWTRYMANNNTINLTPGLFEEVEYTAVLSPLPNDQRQKLYDRVAYLIGPYFTSNDRIVRIQFSVIPKAYTLIFFQNATGIDRWLILGIDEDLFHESVRIWGMPYQGTFGSFNNDLVLNLNSKIVLLDRTYGIMFTFQPNSTTMDLVGQAKAGGTIKFTYTSKVPQEND